MALTPELARLLGQRPTAPAPSVLRPAVVVRSDASGVWAAYLGADPRSPLGPCRGAVRRPRTTTEPTTAGTDPHHHDQLRDRLPVGTRVLVVEATDGPWVVAHDEGTP